MTKTERETLERLQALTTDLGPPATWICTECSYIAIYDTRRQLHERTTRHIMKEDNGQ